MNTNKKLPPTPLSFAEPSSNLKSYQIEVTTPSSSSSSSSGPKPITNTDNHSLIQAKTLKRKNFKQLQLTSNPLISLNTDDNNKNSPIHSHLSNSNSPAIDPEQTTSTDKLISQFSNLEINLEFKLDLKDTDLLTLKKLGSGNSGTVWKVLHLPTQKTMAKKSIHIETKISVQTQILRELRIMHECHSPYIIEFYGAYLDKGSVVICMEYLNCGSLDKLLKWEGKFPDYVLKKVSFDVLSGLTYLYDEHKIIHRDVKPSNVLMNHKGQFKLCDFGVSRELANSLADTFVGTSTYMSPERIQGGAYSIKSDVWSIGLMLVELATGKFPFGDNQSPEGILDLLQRIVNEKPPSLSPENFDPKLCLFVDQCLLKVDKRLNPWELLNHEYLENFSNSEDEKLCKIWAKKIRKLQKEKN